MYVNGFEIFMIDITFYLLNGWKLVINLPIKIKWTNIIVTEGLMIGL